MVRMELRELMVQVVSVLMVRQAQEVHQEQMVQTDLQVFQVVDLLQ